MAVIGDLGRNHLGVIVQVEDADAAASFYRDVLVAEEVRCHVLAMPTDVLATGTVTAVEKWVGSAPVTVVRENSR